MNVNSFTMFGERNRWASNFASNIRQHLALYPGWMLWIHTDTELTGVHGGGYLNVIDELARRGIVRVTVVPQEGRQYQHRTLCTRMLWRMLPLWQETEYVFCRDLDSILTPRQLQCVRSFIASGMTAHGINDNLQHTIPLMGGMCGFNTRKFHDLTGNQSLEELVMDWHTEAQWNTHGADQEWLMKRIWPLVRDDTLVHAIEGFNDRSMDKIITDADISDIPDAIRQRGDDFTNYIGAQGAATDRGSFSQKEICDFYDEHCEACRVVHEAEEAVGWNTTHTGGIYADRNHSGRTLQTLLMPRSLKDLKSNVM